MYLTKCPISEVTLEMIALSEIVGTSPSQIAAASGSCRPIFHGFDMCRPYGFDWWAILAKAETEWRYFFDILEEHGEGDFRSEIDQ